MRTRSAAMLLAVIAVTGCINAYYQGTPRPLERPTASDSASRVLRPVRVHMLDGGTVIFRGATIGPTAITALSDSVPGRAFALLDTAHTWRRSVPLDSVAALEVVEDEYLATQSSVVSLAGTAIGALGALGLAKALFGSCPTVYADSAGTAVLQAEGFSYAIAPRLEHRDVDLLSLRPDADGVLRLELRNEAPETHYINHMELVAVTHDAGAAVLPDQQRRPALVRATRPVMRAVDRAGRDVRGALAAADGVVFASDTGTLNAARAGDLYDWIDITAGDLPPGDSLVVVLRMRNSLLNTVLLYDGMLGGRDAAAWLGDGLADPANALALGAWYLGTMGLHVEVAREGGAPYRTRLGDVGPIAWRDVALVLPRPARDAREARVRLRFVADNWRIDLARIAASVERPGSRTVAPARLVVPSPARGAGPVHDDRGLAALRSADGRYLETRPGQRMVLEFDDAAGAAADGQRTTYLLAWQGWYREWLRGEWLRTPTRTAPFAPGDAALAAALERWRLGRAELEQRFYATRMPVR